MVAHAISTVHMDIYLILFYIISHCLIELIYVRQFVLNNPLEQLLNSVVLIKQNHVQIDTSHKLNSLFCCVRVTNVICAFFIFH